MSNKVNSGQLAAQDRKFLALAMLLSALIHLIYFTPIGFERAPKTEKILNVAFIPAPDFTASPKRQIVSPSESQISIKPELSNKLSDKDTSTKIETIKRGDAPDAGPVPAKQVEAPAPKPQPPSPAPAKPSQTAPEKAAPKKLDLSTDYGLIGRLSKTEPKKTSENSPAKSTPTTQPFSRAVGASAAFVGRNGVPDYIPGIRDGDITLLNAKADKFAVFVRRVAIQVFNYIKQLEWQNLSAQQIAMMATSSMVVAVLDRQGNFQSLRLVQASGSTAFDGMLESAVGKGAHDPNPPAEALAEDGTFRFIFKAKSWTRFVAPGPRSRGGEQRWLMLQTGLE